MTITNKLSIDLARREAAVQADAVQGDCGRKLSLLLHTNAVPWPIPENVRALIRYCKSDGIGGEYDTLPDSACAWSAADNVLTVALAPQVLTTPGQTTLSVLLTDGEKEVSTFDILLHVHPDIRSRTAASETYVRLAPTPAMDTALADIGARIMSGRISSIVLLGDSITDGAGGTGYNGSYSQDPSTNTEGYCWANAFAKFARERYGIRVQNKGMYGSVLSEQTRRAAELVTENDFVIWLTGTNDRWDADAYRAHLRPYLAAVRDKCAGMLVISSIPATAADEQEKPVSMQKMDEILMGELAGFVPHFSMYQELISYCRQEQISLSSCFADHCHPNDLGYFIMFRILCRKLGLPLDPYTDYQCFGPWWTPIRTAQFALASSRSQITEDQCSAVGLDAGIVPMAMMHGYNGTSHTTVFSGKLISKLDLYVASPGLITIGIADLNTCGQGRPVFTKTKEVTAAKAGFISVSLDWTLGANETLCLQDTTDTGKLGFVVTGTPMRIWQASEFEAGAKSTDITVHGTVYITAAGATADAAGFGDVLLDGTDDYSGSSSTMFLASDIVPVILMADYNASARTTALSGKSITGVTMQVNTPGAITIGKVDLNTIGQMPVFTESRTFAVPEAGEEIAFPLYMQLGAHETLAFQCTSDTGALSFVTISGDLFIWKSSAFAAGAKDADLILVGKVYGK